MLMPNLTKLMQKNLQPRPSSSEYQPYTPRCRLDPQSGHMQKSTNECMDGKNNKLMILSQFFPSSLPLKSMSKKNF